jgi:ribosome-interacting GTPase 1
MPANLTPEYLDAEQEYKAARTHQERIAALERMLATVPKHKGTEKLQADIKRRLSQERKEAHKKGGSRSAPVYLVEKEGAGQLALIGPPNSGKSSLVAALTHAEPEIAEFPFSTRLPCPGMMQFENVQIQLVDLPPLSREFMEPWLPQAIRHVGEGILVVDISDPGLLEEIEFIEGLLEERRLNRPRMLVANKSDLDPTGEDFQVLKDLLGERYRMLAVSAATGSNLDRFRKEVFDLLELVRVYTKRPGEARGPDCALCAAPRGHGSGCGSARAQGFRRAPEVRPAVCQRRQARWVDGGAHPLSGRRRHPGIPPVIR